MMDKDTKDFYSVRNNVLVAFGLATLILLIIAGINPDLLPKLYGFWWTGFNIILGFLFGWLIGYVQFVWKDDDES